MLKWRRDATTEVKPCFYEAEVGDHLYRIDPWEGADFWSLEHFGPHGDYEPALEIGTVAECKAAAERLAEELSRE